MTIIYGRSNILMFEFSTLQEYWVSALHKSLVGRVVLDSKLSIGNATTVQLFSHCTRIFDQPPPESVLNPTVRYERGAITVYGVNTGSESIRLAFKAGLRSHETMHLYVLTEESKNPTSP